MARAGCSRWAAGTVAAAVCAAAVRGSGGSETRRPGACAVRATRASLRGCAGSAERLGARGAGAGAALGAGGAPGRDELTAVAPGLSAKPGGGSSAAPRRGRAGPRATMLGLDACELGAQLLELLRLALCARGEPPGWGQGGHVGEGVGGALAGAGLSLGWGPAPPSWKLWGLAWGPCDAVLLAALWRGWGASFGLNTPVKEPRVGGSACEAWVMGDPPPPGTCPPEPTPLGGAGLLQGVQRFLRSQERSVQGLTQTLSQDTVGRAQRPLRQRS